MKQYLILALMIIGLSASYAQESKTVAALKQKVEKGDANAAIKLAYYYEVALDGCPRDSVAAFKLYQKADQLGHKDAKAHMAVYYIEGKGGVARDTNQYYQLSKASADAGSALGLYRQGVCYSRGFIVKRDFDKGYELTVKAANMGCPNALESMGNWYRMGYRTKADKKKAIAYYEKAIKNGGYSGYAKISGLYAEDNNPKKAWEYLNKGLAFNDVESMVLEANYYANGMGVARDEVKAAKLYQRIFETYPEDGWNAERYASFLLMAQDASLRDTLLAVKVLKKVIDWGDYGPYIVLSQIYYAFPDEASKQKSFECAKRYAEKGNEDGYYQLWYLYNNGIGVEADQQKGLEALQKGVDLQDGSCALTLAIEMLNSGNADMMKAIELLNSAIEWGNYDAFYTLNQVYTNMERTDLMYSNAKKAIDYGDVDGYYYMTIAKSSMGDDKGALKTCHEGLKKGSYRCGEVLVNYYNNNKKYDKTYEILEQMGTDESYLYQANMLLSGYVGKQTSKELQTAISKLNKSADMGNESALVKLGNLYLSDKYGLKNEKVALGYFERLAQQGSSEGYFQLGNYYEGVDESGFVRDSVLSIKNYRIAADMGHGDALCWLGEFYMHGQFLPKDSVEAFKHFSQAKDLGSPSGYYFVGVSYLRGVGVEKDTAKAVENLLPAARMEEGGSCAIIGDFYRQGLGGFEANIDSAIAYYYLGSKSDNPTCDYQMGLYFNSHEDYNNAYEYFYSSAKHRNPEAMVKVALFLKEGIVTDGPRYDDAYQILEKAATYDCANAYLELGVMRINGFGCQADPVMAKSYFDTAASLGNSTAVYDLGICYRNGIGCQADSLTAISYFEQAAEMGNIRAINELGQIYEDAQMYKEAVALYENGVKEGSFASMCRLGNCYEQGHGVILNSTTAFNYYMMAAEHNYGLALFLVANCYLEGTGVEDNILKAEEYFNRAVQQGNILAAYQLGVLYQNGESDDHGNKIEADKKKAKTFFTIAASAGYEPAKAALEKLK